MARRRTCFSCGQAQSGSGAFCSSCGKPVDAPHLEMLSGDASADAGTDVTLAHSGSRFRSVLVIGAVIAAIGSVAEFTGNTAKSSSASTTTEPTTSTTEPATTTVAPLVPRKLDALPLPGETTGATLLLLGGSVWDGSLARSRILDVDGGVLTILNDTRSNGDQIMFAPTSKGLVATPTYGGNGSIEVWQRNGSVRPVTAAHSSGGTVFGGPAIFAGDTLWAAEYNAEGSGRQSLTSFSFRTGERVVWLKDASDVSLMGVDVTGRPVVNGIDGGAYTFDPLTRTFARLTSAIVETISAAGRVEIQCTEALLCTDVFHSADGRSQPLQFPKSSRGNVSLSPDGKHAVKLTYDAGPNNQITFDVADTSTGEVVHLGGFDQARGPTSFPAWTGDGRWLFLPTTAGLAAWREGLSVPLIMQVDGKPIESFAVGVFPN